MPHWFLLGVLGNASRTNTPRNEGIRSFLTESVISKFDSGLLGNTIPSTEIIVFNKNEIFLQRN